MYAVCKRRPHTARISRTYGTHNGGKTVEESRVLIFFGWPLFFRFFLLILCLQDIPQLPPLEHYFGGIPLEVVFFRLADKKPERIHRGYRIEDDLNGGCKR